MLAAAGCRGVVAGDYALQILAVRERIAGLHWVVGVPHGRRQGDDAATANGRCPSLRWLRPISAARNSRGRIPTVRWS
jgi:hypothetical protein